MTLLKQKRSQKFIDNFLLGNLNLPRFACQSCSFLTDIYEVIKNHVSTHSTFYCNYCGKHFGRKDSLKTHLNHHTGEKPFKCDICDMKFSARIERCRHKKKHGRKKLC